jgi:PAS domain S-box-containing protein
MPRSPATLIPSFLRGRIGLALVAALGIGLTLSITGYLHREHQRLIATEIERRVSLRHDLLRQTLQDYEAALFALRLLVQHSEDLTPEEFAQAAAESAARVPGIQAVQWVPLLRDHQLPDFVRRARGLVTPDFTPRYRDERGHLAPLPSAPPADREHALVTYIHPLAENEAALAYDILSAPTAPDLARARQTPRGIVLSRRFDLAQGGEGVVLLTYIERSSSQPPPLGGPGFVQLVLRLETALGRAWNSVPNTILDVMLVDSTEGHAHIFSQIGDTPYAAATPPPDDIFPTQRAITRELVLGGRHWRAYYRPRPGWIEARRSSAPLFSLVGSSLLTLLSLAYVNTLRRRTARIAHEVRSRTAELAESRAMLDEIIDHNPGVIWVKDATLRYQLVNLRFCSAYRLSRPEILGKSDHGLHADPVVEAMEAVDRRVLATGDTVSFEESYDMPDRRRTYLVSKFPLRAPDGSIRAVSGIATDITELREAESGRRAIERKLLENQKLESLVILAGGVAHDFNNLLTGILGHANLLRALLPEADAAQNSVAQIEIASHRAAALCRQMLAYSGRGRLAVRSVDPGQIAREAAEFLRLSVARQASFRYQLAAGLPPVTADPEQIRQLAMNLLINAAEALPEGRGDITLSTRALHADAQLFSRCVLAPELPAGTYVCLEITDQGCGMPPDLLARVFDPFFTSSKLTK